MKWSVIQENQFIADHPSLKGTTSKSMSIKYAKKYNEQII